MGDRNLSKMKLVWLRVVVVTFVSCIHSPIASGQPTKEPFTVADEIGLTLFDDPNGGRAKVSFSPDGNYFAVWTERGRLDLNCVEDSLRFYRSQDVVYFLKHPDVSKPPSPAWVVDRSNTDGGSIHDWRWLADSSGVAFIGHTNEGSQLVLADLRTKVTEPLTSTTEVVGTFDVRDRQHYVYTAADQIEQDKLQEKTRAEAQAAAMVGTNHSLRQLLFPDNTKWRFSPHSYLWAVISGKRFEVKQDGAPVVPGDLALSPDGSSLVTTLPLRQVPSSWETSYPPPFEASPYRIRTGRDNPVHQYVRIDLQTGSIQSLTDAPVSWDAGWSGGGRPSWSSDGRAVLLPTTFLSSKDHTPSSPCVAVVDLISNTRRCVETLKRQTDEKDYYLVLVAGAVFAAGNKERVIVSAYQNSSFHTIDYHLTSDGVWKLVAESKSDFVNDEYKDLEIMVKEGLDEPPLLIAKNKQRAQVIWNPNPQLKNIELGHASVYTWRTKEGRELKGGLYKPADYKLGQRYPLVIQTHGFRELEFKPSGFLPTGSAARSLAAAGILVLQIGERCPYDTPSEGPCAVASYESAVNQLVSQGLADPERIGIIGFSRTCFYVMKALTAGSLHFKAALITDGLMASYLQYISTVDLSENEIPRQFDSMIGASPFGEGLQRWLERSPAFNLDKITAPLLVFAGGRNLLLMWEPYAGLRYLHRPVDLIILNTDEHVLTNPTVRLASQGGSVDWFRFWLKDEEDSDPAKAEQYARWRLLRQSCAPDCRGRSY
jgi:dipeptidyl aminopeptidase/acylaminoacyl peptidase